MVWLPTFDSETAVRAAKQNRPFIKVSENGQLVPQVKEAIALIAKHQLVLATGHNSPQEGLLMLKEGKARGVNHMVVTHAMDNPIFMNVAQMREAVQLGAFIEFDYRLVTSHKDQTDAMRALGPEHLILSEFLMPQANSEPLKHPGVEGASEFVSKMRALGFTEAELDLMVKRNPARLLGLPDVATN
jgi:predicted metal-dependent phosphotriesterase family hydrolase